MKPSEVDDETKQMILELISDKINDEVPNGKGIEARKCA
jgi:hypothetical protein